MRIRPKLREYLRLRVLRRLRGDMRGITIVEMGLIAPVFVLMLMAFYDLAHSLYARTVMEGALQKAARDSALNTSQSRQNFLDEKVAEIIRSANKDAAIVFERRHYKTYAQAAVRLAERYDDTNHNNVCDGGEWFDDRNGNGTRDIDGAGDGQGGARDQVLYTVTASYPRLFPLHGFLGWSRSVNVTGQTILSNQPWAEQTAWQQKDGHCNP